MALMQMLCKTYDNLEQKGSSELLMTAQSTQLAHIEITLNKDGLFREAELLEKDDAETTIPVTESSSSRSNGVAPHPLFDKLKYMAGDYEKYCGEDNTKYYEAYMEQLGEWCQSEYAVIQVQKLYEYLQKKTLIADLIDAGIFSVDENGMLTKAWEMAEKKKMAVGGQADAFLRFRVVCRGEKSELWQNKEIQRQFIRFYLSHGGENGFCCVTGKEGRLCGNHPSKIRHSGDKAKLISSNDKTNFTYRGRLENPEQIYTISYEASQKAHNALKYLIQIQGIRIGEKMFVLWGAQQEKVPELLTDTKSLIDHAPGEQEEEATAERIAEAFQKVMLGYRRELREDSQLVLAGFDAATTGRLAVIFYREYNGKYDCNELIDNIESWHKTCSWHISYVDEDEKKKYYMGAPAPFHMARAIYGTDQNGKLDGNKKIMANAVERMLPCICDGRKIPRDIVRAAVNRAKFPQNYSSLYLWYQVLSVACALYKKYVFDYKKIMIDDKEEEWKMGLSGDDKLAYDCGRLLAVADAIERWALRTKSDNPKEIRATTAMRYYTRFSQKPCDVWGQISNKIMTYRIQLGEKGAYLYKLLGEISGQLVEEQFGSAKNLNGMFCLGFDSMRTELIQGAIEKGKERKENE